MVKLVQIIPTHIQSTLDQFVETAKITLGDNLHSILLFGSGAEGKLRTTSDVNMMMVLHKFKSQNLDGLRDSFRATHASILLNLMIIQLQELPFAADAFATKFDDILHRHKILYGENPLTDLKISPSATLWRLEQVVLNLTLRLREKYLLMSLRSEQLISVIADAAGPLRTTASTLLDFEKAARLHPKEALENFVTRIEGANWNNILKHFSEAREGKNLSHEDIMITFDAVFRILNSMHESILALKARNSV